MSLSRLLFGKNPSSGVGQFLDQIPGQARATYDPYIKRGNEAAEATYGQYNQMASDPYAMLDEAYERYSPSKGYQFKQKQLEQALRNSAAAGGFAGTPYHQQQQGELTQSLLDSDFDQFYEKISGLRTKGLEGQQHYADQGFGANKELNDTLINSLQQQAGLKFQGQAQRNQNQSDLLRSLSQGLGFATGKFF